MMGRFKGSWIVLAAVLSAFLVVAACASDDPDPTATPEPTATSVPTAAPAPSFDIASLGVDAADLDSLGITEADIQCLALEVEAEILEQVVGDDLSAADVLSVLPALQACGVDLVQLIEGADSLLAVSAGADYEGLDSLPFTAEQIACLVLISDAELLESLVEGDIDQVAIVPVLEAFGVCGVGLADLLGLAGGVDLESTLDDAAADSAPIDLPQLLPGALDAPDIPGVVETGELADLASDLPFTTEQLECLGAEIEIDTIQALVDGEVNPLRMLSFIGVLSTCGVDLSDLGN
jgi:hypothetical protein